MSFYISISDEKINNVVDSVQFVTKKTLSSSNPPFLPSLTPNSDPMADAYKTSLSFQSSSNKLQLTALALVDGPKSGEVKSSSTPTISSEQSGLPSTSSIRPCLVSGVTVNSSSSFGSASSSTAQLHAMENVWASADLVSSSSLVRAMNSANSAASSNSLDIMKVATGEICHQSKSHYLVLCDFHHKNMQPQPTKKDSLKDGTKSKKQLSGTGTSASSNGIRQENLYQEILLSKFLLEEINEDVDSEMVGSAHFDSIYPSPHAVLSTPTANGIFYEMPVNSSMPTSSTFDTNSNPISPYASEPLPFGASSSKMKLLKKSLDSISTSKAEPVVVQTIRIDADDRLRVNNILTTKDGKHLFVTLSPHVDANVSDFGSSVNQMDIDDESKLIPTNY